MPMEKHDLVYCLNTNIYTHTQNKFTEVTEGKKWQDKSQPVVILSSGVWTHTVSISHSDFVKLATNKSRSSIWSSLFDASYKVTRARTSA